VGITAGPSESQPLVVTATSNNTGLIPNPTVNYVSPNATGSLNYTPVANQNGSAVITVTVHDPGADGTPGNGDDLTFSRQFTVLVNSATAVNHAPSFVKGPDVPATDEDGPRSLPGWATNISPGAPEEAAQTLNFIVTPDNGALFTTAPAIDPTGKLTFTPAPNAHGLAQITVRLHDNGGTANGGVDTSAPQTFNITITKPHVWYNALNPLDVTGDGHVVAGDALQVINYINAFTASAVPANAPFGPNYLDVTQDNFVAPGDALAIINAVNSGQGGEGESAASSADAVFQEMGRQSPAPSAIDALMLASVGEIPNVSRRRF
jgi:Dockerin type I domain